VAVGLAVGLQLGAADVVSSILVFRHIRRKKEKWEHFCDPVNLGRPVGLDDFDSMHKF
jgi:hypothetical protein